MKERKFTSGTTFFLGPDLYEKVNDEAYRRKISKSELIREALKTFFREQEVPDSENF